MKVSVTYIGYVTKEVEIDDKYKDIIDEAAFAEPIEQAIEEQTGETCIEVAWVNDENGTTIWEA